jgi:hypothetical protein
VALRVATSLFRVQRQAPAVRSYGSGQRPAGRPAMRRPPVPVRGGPAHHTIRTWGIVKRHAPRRWSSLLCCRRFFVWESRRVRTPKPRATTCPARAAPPRTGKGSRPTAPPSKQGRRDGLGRLLRELSVAFFTWAGSREQHQLGLATPLGP